MPALLSQKEVAAQKGCSKKTVHRACVKGRLNTDFDPVTGEYQVYDDETLVAWQPGESGKNPAKESAVTD